LDVVLCRSSRGLVVKRGGRNFEQEGSRRIPVAENALESRFGWPHGAGEPAFICGSHAKEYSELLVLRSVNGARRRATCNQVASFGREEL